MEYPPGRLCLFDSVASMKQYFEHSGEQRYRTASHVDMEEALFGQYGMEARVVIQDGVRFVSRRGRSSPLGTYEDLMSLVLGGTTGISGRAASIPVPRMTLS